jgi:hypothetical protein
MGNTEIEVLGYCRACGKDVTFTSGMSDSVPLYPMHEFDHEEKEEYLYHWGCLDPSLFRGRQRHEAQDL